jgi:hypothetical protein
LVFVYFPLTGLLDITVTIDTFAGSLGNLPGLRPLRLTPHGPLGNLLPLYLADERACRKDESSDGSIFKLFSYELELSTRLLNLIE